MLYGRRDAVNDSGRVRKNTESGGAPHRSICKGGFLDRVGGGSDRRLVEPLLAWRACRHDATGSRVA
jgi:hypothetical protein